MNRWLIFGTASRHNPLVQEAFGDYVSLRHQQHIELIPEHRESLTVGVLLTPRIDGLRPWDTTMAATALLPLVKDGSNGRYPRG